VITNSSHWGGEPDMLKISPETVRLGLLRIGYVLSAFDDIFSHSSGQDETSLSRCLFHNADCTEQPKSRINGAPLEQAT
jgi:hypothetical protein